MVRKVGLAATFSVHYVLSARIASLPGARHLEVIQETRTAETRRTQIFCALCASAV
jgi:hypothetical protein